MVSETITNVQADPVTESVIGPSLISGLADRIPELIAAIIVLWLVFRFLENTHSKVIAAVDKLTDTISSLHGYLENTEFCKVTHSNDIPKEYKCPPKEESKKQ